MRGQWDHEQPLSPSLLRSAVALLSGLLAAWAIVSTVMSVIALFEGRYGPAAVQFTAGLAVPFAIWLGARILCDLLIVHHRTLDKVDAVAERFEGPSPAAAPRAPPPSQNTRAGDDGPVYPEEASAS
jgi:hypothetical protein